MNGAHDPTPRPNQPPKTSWWTTWLVRFWPLFAALVASLLFWLLDVKVAHLVHKVTDKLPPPPPAVPLDDGRERVPVVWPEFLGFLATAVYLVWHLRPSGHKPQHAFRPLLVTLALSLGGWVVYNYALIPWLTCDYQQKRYTIGLYYTEAGREYAKSHECHETIKDHPGQLGTIWSSNSIACANAILAFAHLSVFILLLLTLCLILEILFHTFFPHPPLTPGG